MNGYPYNNQNTGYPPQIYPQCLPHNTNTNAFRPHPYLMNGPIPTTYPTSVPSVHQHTIQPQQPYIVPQITLQPQQPIYTQAVAVPVQPQPPRPLQTDDNKINKLMDDMRLENEKRNKKMDELLLNMNMNMNNNNRNTNTNYQTQNSYRHKPQNSMNMNMKHNDYNYDDKSDEYDDYDILVARKESTKHYTQNLQIDIDTHKRVLWTAVNIQSAAVKKISAETNLDTAVIKSSLIYWSKKKLMAKHGRNGHRLVDELKKHNINLHNSFLRKLQNQYGEFQFVAEINEQDGLDTDSECEFFTVDNATNKQLTLHVLCKIYLLLPFIRSSVLIK